MWGIMAMLGLASMGAKTVSHKMRPQLGTQEYLIQQWPNSPYMRACTKVAMAVTYRNVPWTREEIEAYNNHPSSIMAGKTYEKWREEMRKKYGGAYV